MSAEVTTALVAGLVSLTVAVVTAVLTGRQGRRAAAEQTRLQGELATLQDELGRQARLEEEERSARKELERYREPLLLAALDLAHRLYNIRRMGFFETFADDARRADLACKSTLYRFGVYWAVAERLQADGAVLRFADDPETRPTAQRLYAIGSAMARDRLDDGRLMMWREEQRAVAERMQDPATGRPVGFATFVERYPQYFAPWFEAFVTDLEAGAGRTSERLRLVQHGLAELVVQLDDRSLYSHEVKRLRAG